MIKLQDVSYVRLGTADLDGATKFATDYLGLEISHRVKDAVYLKSDQREHTLCYFHGSPADQTAAFEVANAPIWRPRRRSSTVSATGCAWVRRRKPSCARCGASSPFRIPPATTSSWCGGLP